MLYSDGIWVSARPEIPEVWVLPFGKAVNLLDAVGNPR
jgi:hypothetical protein